MKKLIIILGILLALIIVAGVIAPTEMKVEREVTINKPKDIVFNYLRMLRNGQAWNPWSRKDPNIKTELKGADGTVGAVYSWVGNKEVGSGEQEIKNISEGSRIDFELRFSAPMTGTSEGYLVTEDLGENQTKVKWGMVGKNPFPFSIICMVLNLKDKLSSEFDQGLATLKSTLESN
jgi:hypothetical protein